MDGLEEVSIDDLLNNSEEEKDTGPTFIYKKSSTKPKENYAEDDENDINIINPMNISPNLSSLVTSNPNPLVSQS